MHMNTKIAQVVTQADLLRLDEEEKWAEVVNGLMVEMEDNVPLIHVLLMQKLLTIFERYLQIHPIGRVFGDGARFVLKGTRERVELARKPDFAFVLAEHIPDKFDLFEDFYGAPDLAVEIVSPGQTNKLFAAKIADYLEAGTSEVWIIHRQRGTLTQYRYNADAPMIYKDADMIDTSLLFLGLTLTMHDLFDL